MLSARSQLVAAAGMLAFAFLPNLHGEFVWDDAPLIEHNPALRSARGFVAILTRDLWGQATGVSSQYYRPLPTLSVWLQTWLFGMRIEPLRVVSIGIHVLACVLFVCWLERRSLSKTIALAAGILVLVHPSVCEPVMWIIGRDDTLALVTLFGGLLAWPTSGLASQASAWLRALGCGCGLALAFLCKEAYLVGPLLLGLQQGSQQIVAKRWPDRRVLGQLALACAPLAAVCGLRQILGFSLGSAQLHVGLAEHARNYASIVWHYAAQLAAFQNGLTLDRFVPLTAGAAAGVWAMLSLVSAALVIGVLRTGGGWLVAALGWFWFLVSLLPHVISIPSIGFYGNRYGYCALFGLATCAAGLCATLPRPSPRGVSLAQVAVLLLAASCALRTSVEASRWHDSRTLFAADVARDPNNGFALYHLGTAVLRNDGCEHALPLFVRATELAPAYERSWHNAAGCFINLGQPARALPFAQGSVKLAPFNSRARYNLAVALSAHGEPQRALDQLQIAVRLDPKYLEAANALAALKPAAGHAPMVSSPKE